ncbi:MAG: Fur family transcriptional regulator [Candidatus Coproplasma sp.]
MDTRNTEQKRIIREALKRADHPTASELYRAVQAENPHISRATVFRVLAQFADCGEARKLEFIGSDTRYDGYTQPHAHCRCVICGKIADVYDEKLVSVLCKRNVAGYAVYSAALEFNGVCPDCSKAN